MPGAARLVTALRKAHLAMPFLSNKPHPRLHPDADKLTRLGLPTKAEEAVNSLIYATGWLLREKLRTRWAFPSGRRPSSSVRGRRPP